MNVFASIIIATLAVFGRDGFSRNIYLDIFFQSVLVALSLLFMGAK